MPVAGAQSIQANARARWMPSMSSASDSMFESMRVGTLASPYPPTIGSNISRGL